MFDNCCYCYIGHTLDVLLIDVKVLPPKLMELCQGKYFPPSGKF